MADIALIVGAAVLMEHGRVMGIPMFILGILYLLVCWIPFAGLKVIKPNEALVLTLFGKY